VVKDLMVVMVIGLEVHMAAVAAVVLEKRVKMLILQQELLEMVVMDYHLPSLDLLLTMLVVVLVTQLVLTELADKVVELTQAVVGLPILAVEVVLEIIAVEALVL
tara:strand:+ start:431 stop:745 length:315 start_codon:yes stop_codon:yes gene_type:complete